MVNQYGLQISCHLTASELQYCSSNYYYAIFANVYSAICYKMHAQPTMIMESVVWSFICAWEYLIILRSELCTSACLLDSRKWRQFLLFSQGGLAIKHSLCWVQHRYAIDMIWSFLWSLRKDHPI